jgi:hypothetical protein
MNTQVNDGTTARELRLEALRRRFDVEDRNARLYSDDLLKALTAALAALVDVVTHSIRRELAADALHALIEEGGDIDDVPF